MQVVIEHQKTKREIKGNGFNICGSRQDLLQIAQEIHRQVKADEFGYGWVKIRDEIEDEHTAPNSKAMAWVEEIPF